MRTERASGISECIRFRWLSSVVLPVLLLTSGCAYHFGNGFDQKIRSIHVPIFQSEVQRRGLEFQLTEAVQKQIQSRTQFRLVSESEADTLLTGKIVSVRKNVLGENGYDDPRELQISLAVDITWQDLRTQKVISEQRYQIPNEMVNFTSRAEFAPEVGQSLATAYQQSFDRLARDIVNMMETPW